MSCKSSRRLVFQLGLSAVCILLNVQSAPCQQCGEIVDAGFEAESWTASLPADCSIAVGSDYILSLTNLGRSVFTRGGSELVNESLADFFGFEVDRDAVCLFDRAESRYFVLMMESFDSLAFGVSDTSDPRDRDDWFFTTWENPLPGLLDFPNMTLGPDHVFFTWARTATGTPGQAVIAYADKEDLLNGQTPALTVFPIGAISGQATDRIRAIGCMRMYDQPSSSIAYFITDSHSTSGENNMVRLYALDADATINPLVHHDLTVPDYKTAPLKVALPGDAEITCLWDFKFPVFRNGSAWIAHAIGRVNAQEEIKTAKVRWHEIAMNGWPLSQEDPTLVQSGTINPGDDISAFYPVIHVDDDGNVAFAYNQCSPSQHVSIRRAIRKHYDDESTLRAPLLLLQSESSLEGSQQWADYAQMDEDAAYPGVMWSHLMWWEGTSTRKT